MPNITLTKIILRVGYRIIIKERVKTITKHQPEAQDIGTGSSQCISPSLITPKSTNSPSLTNILVFSKAKIAFLVFLTAFKTAANIIV